MKLYSIDMLIHATAYVRAETPEEAARLASQFTGLEIELDDGMSETQIVSGLAYDDEDLPEASLSPAATIGVMNGEPEEVQP